LAEVLHKFVWEVEGMGSTEYFGWIRYFDSKNNPEETNLLNMDQDKMIKELT
jgi:hypothetical protein